MDLISLMYPSILSKLKKSIIYKTRQKSYSTKFHYFYNLTMVKLKSLRLPRREFRGIWSLKIGSVSGEN